MCEALHPVLGTKCLHQKPEHPNHWVWKSPGVQERWTNTSYSIAPEALVMRPASTAPGGKREPRPQVGGPASTGLALEGVKLATQLNLAPVTLPPPVPVRPSFSPPTAMEDNLDRQQVGDRKDAPRLSRQLIAVASVMADGRWYTLSEISKASSAPEASVGARLRDMRKEQFGGLDVQRESVGDGLFKYRVQFNYEEWRSSHAGVR